MYIFRTEKGAFAFSETPDGTYKAALFEKAYGISTIERDPPNSDFSEYLEQWEKVDNKARAEANKIMTPEQAFFSPCTYNLLVENAARKMLENEIDLEKYRIDLA